ncbi:MAG: ParB/RepB/Spo0J family partition protein [Devosia sp.]|nr:ParB/RepB/Spo0J family partition protein [Devosia sp.]
MAKATPKITLSASRDIPFNQLVLSQANVRRIKRGQTIEDLAIDIARRGLLQSLNVRPVLGADGVETEMFEIPAGGRRYRALELLVKQKRMSKTQPVPCIVRDAGGDIPAEEDSLAENVHREELHPLDQFRAFKDLRDKGIGEEEIAARFFVPVNVVHQRLKLAAVSPSLLDVYAEDGMTLEQLMAFSVSTDHARQEQVWEALKTSWSKEPYQIRRMLTENTARVADRRVQFVTVEAYEAAGGVVLRDLFESDDGGWVQDVPLLDRLVTDKLKAEADTVAAEGWKWIEIAASFPYGYTSGLGRIEGAPAELTSDEQASLKALKAEQEGLERQYEDADELHDEVDARLGELETALAAFEDRPAVFDRDQVVNAGAFVSVGHDGSLSVERGYVRPEDLEAIRGSHDDEATDDQAEADGAAPATVITIAGQTADEDDDEGDGHSPLPDRLLVELTAHRTLALRNAVADNPQIALTLLLHRLVSDRFHLAGVGCLQIYVQEAHFPVQSADLGTSVSATAIAERQESWKVDVPTEDGALWDWLISLDDASRLALLAHCVSFGVNALHEKADRYSSGPSAHAVQQRLDQADRLARAVGLDMVEAGWRPSVDNYLGRVTKARILDAVREARGEGQAQLIDHLKKTEMAHKAQELLADTGWLPGALRTPDAPTVVETDSAGGETAMADPGASTEDDEAATVVPAIAAE